MTYQKTVDWMFQQLPMYQQIGKTAYKSDLSNIQKLSEHLNNPHHRFKTIHVAGTNGKGSTSHMLASVLQEAGYKVGLYTSPHLKDFRERIKVNGKEIPEGYVVQFIQSHKSFFESHQLSFFEMTVGLAFDFFEFEKVDIAVIEVGLGGRLDSTNIIVPELSVITNIGLDHVQILGNKLADIAAEKAGIIKEGVPVVVGETTAETKPVFDDFAKQKNAVIFYAEKDGFQEYNSDLKGNYQKYNKRTVLRALKVMQSLHWDISEEAIVKGLIKVKENTGLRGRWEVLHENPKVICDTAHNVEGLKYVVAQLREKEYDKLHIVFGVVNDKDLKKILPLLPKNAKFYFCKPNVPRGMQAEILQEKAADFELYGAAYNSVTGAYEEALNNAAAKDLVYVGGSTFTVAEII